MRTLALFATAAVAAATTVDLTKPAIHDELIQSVNSASVFWTAGVNSKFINMTLGQAKRLMGAKRDPVRRAALPHQDVTPLPADAIPAAFNATAAWPKCAKVIGHIRDQSDCGCCWAFGSTEAFNDRLCIAYNITTELSAQDTCSCCNGNNGCAMSGGCDGGFTEDAFNYFAQTGVVTGGDNPTVGSGSSCFPFQLQMCDHHEGGPYIQCPNVCSGGECNTPACPADSGAAKCSEAKYPTPWAKDKHFAKTGARQLNGVAAIQTEIMARGPVSASFTVYNDFLTYKTGVYTHVSGAELGGHAVRIYGWGTEGGVDYWLVANSWNTYWGDSGSFKIKRGVDECGIESDVVVGNA